MTHSSELPFFFLFENLFLYLPLKSWVPYGSILDVLLFTKNMLSWDNTIKSRFQS